MSILVEKKKQNIQMVLFDGWILCCLKNYQGTTPRLRYLSFLRCDILK
jgi:hypothetical protein